MEQIPQTIRIRCGHCVRLDHGCAESTDGVTKVGEHTQEQATAYKGDCWGKSWRGRKNKFIKLGTIVVCFASYIPDVVEVIGD